MKNEQEMLDYIERYITQQGNEGAAAQQISWKSILKNSGAKPFTIMLHSEVRNNINNDNLWSDVKNKQNITIAWVNS